MTYAHFKGILEVYAPVYPGFGDENRVFTVNVAYTVACWPGGGGGGGGGAGGIAWHPPAAML